MRQRTLIWIGIGLSLASADLRAGEPVPRGDEFQVNTYTTDLQGWSAVSPDGSGGFVVVWGSRGSSGSDTEGESIQAQRFAAGGSPVGGEFQVNSYTTSSQLYPAVSPDGTGGFVAAWASIGSSGTDTVGTSIQAQRYAPDGSPLGGEFQVNTYTPYSQLYPAVSPDGSGGFVVVWQSLGSNGTDTDEESVQGQRYGPDGVPIDGEFQINSYTTGSQKHPGVSLDGSGGFVVTWSSEGSNGTDTDYDSIQGQRYGPDGSPVGGEFQVNTYTTNSQKDPAVSADGSGGFVVVWTSRGSSGSDMDEESIQGQRYGSDGSPVGGEFQVNTATTGRQSYSAVTKSASDGFLVTWSSEGAPEGIHAQRYESDGSPAGGQFQVDTSTGYPPQSSPAVSSDGAAGFVVTWQRIILTGPDTGNVYGRRLGQPMFVDGFESGDTSAWSNTVP